MSIRATATLLVSILWAPVGRISPISSMGRWDYFERAAEAVVNGADDLDARLGRLD